MSQEQQIEKKTFIFIVGHAFYNIQDIGHGIGDNLTHSVCITAPTMDSFNSQRNQQNNSLFFSQIMFYSALPSRRNIIIINNDLNKKFILQVLLLCDKIPKDVFIIIDNAFNNESYPKLTKGFPFSRIIYTYKHNYIYKDKKKLFEFLAHEITHNRQFNPGDCYMFNNLYASFPLVFRETIDNILFNEEFGDIPFEQLNKSLLPIFDEVADEEGIEKETNIKLKVEDEKDEEYSELGGEEKEKFISSIILPEETLDANTIDNYFFPLSSFKANNDKEEK